MSWILELNKIPEKETPTKQQVAIVHVLSGDNASKSLSNGLKKKLVLEEPAQQNHRLVTMLRLQRLPIKNEETHNNVTKREENSN